MKTLVIGFCLAGPALSATALGLAPITYPVYLAHIDGDQEIAPPAPELAPAD